MNAGITVQLVAIVLYCVFVRVLGHSSTSSLCQQHVVDQRRRTVAIDCRKRRLTKLPKADFHGNVVELDLSLNHFPELKGHDFRGLVSLVKLNISECGISTLSATTFEGLVNLKELDMKNNPVIGDGLPEGIFDPLTTLQRLLISGSVTDDTKLSGYGKLASLEEITITPYIGNMPYSLAKLEKIRAIFFAFCGGDGQLTRMLLKPFQSANIEQLAFVSCDLKSIDNDSFSGFSSLRSLNLAGNCDLDVDNVIDALSSSKDVKVTTLILDLVNANYSDLGHRDRHLCRRAWSNIENLSLRGNGYTKIDLHFPHCLSNLQRLVFGFNPYTMYRLKQKQLMLLLYKILVNVTYADVSYFGFTEINLLKILIGYYKDMGFVMRNDDYFKLPLETSYSDYSVDGQPKSNCTRLALPHKLAYVIAHHSQIYTGSDLKQVCYELTPNNIRYMDLSYPEVVVGSTTYRPVIYGLVKLETAKFGGLNLYYFNWATLQNCPSLRILGLERNHLGLGPLKPMPYIPRLEELDFSNNFVKTFPKDMFAKLTSLRRLDIHGNELTSLDVHFPNSLDYLDISRNMLVVLDGATRTSLDRLPFVVIDHNPLQCGCDEIEWITWCQRRQRQNHSKESIFCKTDTGPRAVVDVDARRLRQACGLILHELVKIVMPIGLVIFVVASAVVMYRFRWQLRWFYYQIRHRRRVRTNPEMRLLESSTRCSSYVVYDNKDELSREWVIHTLVPMVEDHLQKPMMFVRDRDEFCGGLVLNEVVRGITMSNTAIWVVSPAFFQCSICEYASHFTICQLGMANIICVILENRFERYNNPRQLQLLVCRNSGFKCVRFHEDEDRRRLFWAELDRFIPALV